MTRWTGRPTTTSDERLTGSRVLEDPLDYEARARAVLAPHVDAYYSTGAGSGDVLREGIAHWSAVRFRPRVLTDLTSIQTGTTVLGTAVRTPILVAPMAQQLGAHPEGEVAMGRAVAATGSLLGVSVFTAVPFSSIAATGAPWWLQVYVMRDHSLTELVVRRAVKHGARALLLTVDMTVLLPSTVNPRDWPEGEAKTRHGNLTADELAATGVRGLEMDPSLDVGMIEWLRELSGLPVLVKGVLRADDAQRCVAAGASGVVVSTHGGRRLGPSTTSARALPEVVGAVGGNAEVYVDSGLRTPEHIAAALAMGARAVFLGRPALWALAAEGTPGVEAVLAGFTDGLRRVMGQLGVPRLSELTGDLIA
jgi:4-hydroxymandelate oxidase